MIELASLLTPNMGAIPSSTAEYYIRTEDIEVWADRLEPLTSLQPGGFKVGVCWAGMSRDAHPSAKAIDMLRSTTLQMLAPLAAIKGITWVSLQKGPPSEQIKEHPPMLIGDFTDDMYDFYETCCAMRNCDLVISVDTAVAHASASVGCPTWLLSRWDGCWRWFGDRSDSPWYPTLRQFVQPTPGDWEGMVKNVAKELEKCIPRDNYQTYDGYQELTLAK